MRKIFELYNYNSPAR